MHLCTYNPFSCSLLSISGNFWVILEAVCKLFWDYPSLFLRAFDSVSEIVDFRLLRSFSRMETKPSCSSLNSSTSSHIHHHHHPWLRRDLELSNKEVRHKIQILLWFSCWLCRDDYRSPLNYLPIPYTCLFFLFLLFLPVIIVRPLTV